MQPCANETVCVQANTARFPPLVGLPQPQVGLPFLNSMPCHYAIWTCFNASDICIDIHGSKTIQSNNPLSGLNAQYLGFHQPLDTGIYLFWKYPPQLPLHRRLPAPGLALILKKFITDRCGADYLHVSAANAATSAAAAANRAVRPLKPQTYASPISFSFMLNKLGSKECLSANCRTLSKWI